MKISEISEGPFEGSIEGEIVDMEDVKEIISKFGKRLKVVNGELQDDTGTIRIALWNNDAETFKKGDKIRISNGYVSTFKDQLTLSTGRNGTIEKI